VPSGTDPREPDFEQANDQLNEGLKNCRAVVNNYRAMLFGDQGAADDLPSGEPDSEDGEGGPDQPGGLASAE